MHEAVWSPPIPIGSTATREWGRLDRRTRHELLRSDAPHPDPMIAAVAVGYARAMQPRRWNLRGLRTTFWMLAMVVAALVIPTLSGFLLPSWVIGFAFLLIIIGETALMMRFHVRLMRMEHANAPRLLAAELPALVAGPPPVLPVPGGRFAAGIDGRKMLRVSVRPIVIITAFTMLAQFLGGQVLLVPVLSLLVLTVYLIGLGAVRWSRRRSAVIVMDAAGLVLPDHRLTAGWAEFTEIRIVALRGERHPSRVVVFVPADPEALLGRISGGRLRSARRSRMLYGSPVTISDFFLDRTAEEISAAAAALGGLPVRRFGGRIRAWPVGGGRPSPR